MNGLNSLISSFILFLNEEEAKALSKKEQTDLIRKLGGSDHRIPHFEKDRVELILKLQDKK